MILHRKHQARINSIFFSSLNIFVLPKMNLYYLIITTKLCMFGQCFFISSQWNLFVRILCLVSFQQKRIRRVIVIRSFPFTIFYSNSFSQINWKHSSVFGLSSSDNNINIEKCAAFLWCAMCCFFARDNIQLIWFNGK